MIENHSRPWLNVSDRTYFVLAVLLFGAIVFTIVFASSLFMTSAWTTYDTGRFYAMAEVIVNGATPYLDYQDPKPPLIFFTLALPIVLGQKFLGGLALVGACNLVSAVIVMKIAWELYGRFSGFLAGLLFTVNVAFAQGYFVLTEPFAITFVLLATYFALCGRNRHYLLAGLSLGIAIGFKQYALLAVPLLLFALSRNKALDRAPLLIAGIFLPLVVMFGYILIVYGSQAFAASLYWSFGVAGTYLTDKNVGEVTSYRTTDPLMLAANIAMAACMFTTIMIFAAAGLVRDRRLTVTEQYFLLSAAGFALTILVRQYLHYWVLALPFFAILCARQFRDDR
jgi:uncharacterized membrane protein